MLGDVRDQLQRSALSISNNIAEGFERGTTADLVWYLYIARGSAGETRSGLQFCLRLAELVHQQWPAIKLVATSGRALAHIMPDDGRFIAKPYNLGAMTALIEEVSDDAADAAADPV